MPNARATKRQEMKNSACRNGAYRFTLESSKSRPTEKSYQNDYRPIDSNSRKGYTLIANFGSDVSFCVISQSRTARPGSRGSKEAAGPLLSISSVFGCVVFFPHSTHTQINRDGSLRSFPLGVCGSETLLQPDRLGNAQEEKI